MANQGMISAGNEDGEYAVMLPCSPAAFGDFVSKLLGKPQTIEAYVSGPFTIERADIDNLYHLVTQRVSQQNEATLVQFVVTVGYDDRSSVRLNSFDEFTQYSEIRPRISTHISCSWVYLIRFPGHEAPEKQEINVTFMTELTTNRVSYVPLEARGGFQIRVHHTVRSWGVDMEALLLSHLKTLKKAEENGVQAWIGRNSGWLGVLGGLFVFLGTLVGIFLVSTKLGAERIEWFRGQLMGLDAAEQNARATQLLAEAVFGGQVFSYNLYFALFIIAMIIVSIGCGVWVGTIAEYRPISSLLLTKQANDLHRSQQSSDKTYWIRLSLSLVGTITLGVLSNYVFNFLISKGVGG